MKKSKKVSIILIMIISCLILLISTKTFAANDLVDITNTITGNSAGNNTINNTTNIANNSTGNNTTGNNNTINNSTNNNTVLKTNNTSNYNNTSLPKTGIEDSITGVILVVILGISAVYAYNRIQYYKNI